MAGGASPLLAIVSAIGSLGIGALVGAVVADYLRRRTEREREARERIALLRLISMEMHLNADVAAMLRDVTVLSAPPVSFRTSTWEKAKVRLAQVLDDKDLEPLALYYAYIGHVTDRLQEFQRRKNADVNKVLAGLRKLDRQEDAAWKVVTKHIGEPAEGGSEDAP